MARISTLSYFFDFALTKCALQTLMYKKLNELVPHLKNLQKKSWLPLQQEQARMWSCLITWGTKVFACR